MENNLKKYDFLNSNLVINYWNIHKSNSHDHSKKIWNVMMLLSWLKKKWNLIQLILSIIWASCIVLILYIFY